MANNEQRAELGADGKSASASCDEEPKGYEVSSTSTSRPRPEGVTEPDESQSENALVNPTLTAEPTSTESFQHDLQRFASIASSDESLPDEALTSQVESLQSDITELSSQLKFEKHEKDLLCSKSCELNDQLESVRQERDVLHLKNCEHELTIARHVQKIAQLEEDLLGKDSEAEISKLKCEHELTIAHHEQRIAQLEEDLLGKEAEISKQKCKHELTIAHHVQRIAQLEEDLLGKEAEISKLKEILQAREGRFNLLNYSAQGENRKCRVCYRETNPDLCALCHTSKAEHTSGISGKKFKPQLVIESHAYSKIVLQTACRGNYKAFWDVAANHAKTPTECKWLQLCQGCDSATGYAEKDFNEVLFEVMENAAKYYPSKHDIKRIRIQTDHGDLFFVYTFRALCHNIAIEHYRENVGGCSCKNLLPAIEAFLTKAHHLSHRSIWMQHDGSDHETPAVYIDPSEAGMLFKLEHNPVPDHHLIEFPVIVKVAFTRGNTRISSSEARSLALPESCTIIFAQIPPFYWAFPLVEPADTGKEFDINHSKTAQKLVCKKLKDEAELLLPLFSNIIEAINNTLNRNRDKTVFKEGSEAKLWRDTKLGKASVQLVKDEAALRDREKTNEEQREGIELEMQELIQQRDLKEKLSKELSSDEKRIKKCIKEMPQERRGSKEWKGMNSDHKKNTSKSIKEVLKPLHEIYADIAALSVKLAACRVEEEGFQKERKQLEDNGLYAGTLVPKLVIAYHPSCYLTVDCELILSESDILDLHLLIPHT